MLAIYTLDDRNPVPCGDVVAWARWFETASVQVAETMIGEVRVATVFVGLDHGFSGPPLLFETTISGGAHDKYRRLCSTWERAEHIHSLAVRRVRRERGTREAE